MMVAVEADKNERNQLNHLFEATYPDFTVELERSLQSGLRSVRQKSSGLSSTGYDAPEL